MAGNLGPDYNEPSDVVAALDAAKTAIQGEGVVARMVTITHEEYLALAVKDPLTLYLFVE